MQQQIIYSSFGQFLAQWQAEQLHRLSFEPQLNVQASKHLPKAAARLQAWFDAYEQGSALPELTDLLQSSRTDFQHKIRRVLMSIPQGKLRQYGDIAEELNSGPRAVGQACRVNPYVLIVPCHRVVARNGMGGYAGEKTGQFMELKKRLLAFEDAQHG